MSKKTSTSQVDVIAQTSATHAGKFLISQHAFLKNAKRMLYCTPTTLLFGEVNTSGHYDQLKFDIPLSSITSIQAVKKEDFVIQYKNNKGKSNKETFSSDDRNKLLSLIFRLKAVQDGKEERHFVTKWTKSNQKIDYVLSAVGASFLKIDALNTQITLNQFDMMDIETIYKISDNRNGLVFQFKSSHQRIHYYISSDVDGLIATIQKRLKELLLLGPIAVQSITDDEAIRMRDKNNTLQKTKTTQFNVNHPADKIKKAKGDQPSVTRSKILSLNSEFIVEVDTHSGTTHSIHRTNTVRCLIRSPDDDQTFGIEYYEGGGTTMYKSETRDIIILDIMEMCRRANNQVLVTIEPTVFGVREGLTLNTPSEEYCEILVKRIVNLDKMDTGDRMRVLREFNMSFVLNGYSVKDKSAFKSVFKYCQIVSMEKDIPIEVKRRSVQLALSAVHRLLHCKTIFEDATSYKGLFEFLFQLLASTDSGIRHFTSAILSDLVSSSEHSDAGQKHQAIVFNNPQIIQDCLQKSYSIRDYILCSHNCLFMIKRAFDGKSSLEITSKLVPLLLHIKPVLYRLARSKSISTSLVVLNLLIIIAIRAKNNELMDVQSDVLSNGLIICIIRDALFAECEISRAANLKLVDLLVSFNQECAELIVRMIPASLAKELDTSTARKEVSLAVRKTIFGKTKIKQDSEYQTQTQHWAGVLEQLKKDYVNAEIIWNDGTRNDLKQALQYQTEALDNANDKYSGNCTWNFVEFKVNYPSLKQEPKVGKYYLRYLAGEGKSVIDIENPEKLVMDLYYNLMLERTESLQILTARAMTNIYVNELFPEHKPFPHIDHFVQALSEGNYSKAVIFEGFLLLSSAVQVWENADTLNEKCIPLLMTYVKELHNTQLQNNKPHPGDIASLALNILYQLSLFRTRKLGAGQIIRPIPLAIRNMTSHSNLPYIVQTLAVGATSNPYRKKLISQAISILTHLLEVNDSIIQSVYETGLFYFLFSYIESEQEQVDPDQEVPKLNADTVYLLKHLYSKQHFRAADFGMNDDEANFLRILLPDALLNYMYQQSDSEFPSLFYGEHLSPTIIWNKAMRLYLQNTVRQHLQHFLSRLQTDTNSKYEHTPLQRIVYPQIEKELFIGGYYLSGLLDPQWKGFQVNNPEALFDKIVDIFKVEREEVNLSTMLKVKLLLFDQIKSALEHKMYLGAGKCMDILRVSGENWNVELVELTVRLLFFLSTSINIDEYLKNSAPTILLALLGAIHRRFSQIGDDAQAVKNLQYLLIGVLELFTKLSSYNQMKEQLIADPTFISTVLHYFASSQEPPVLRSTAKLISSGLVAIKPIAEGLWANGLLYLLIRDLTLREESKVNEAKVKCALQVIIPFSNQYPEFTSDLQKLVPGPIIKRLRTSKPELFRTDLLNDSESPHLIWTESTRQILANFIDGQCYSLQQKYPYGQVSIRYEKLSYPEIDNELIIADVFIRVFNNMVRGGTSKQVGLIVDDAKQFMNGLALYIHDMKNKPDEHVAMAIEATNNLLVHVESLENIVLYKQLIAECLSIYDAQQALFQSLKELETRPIPGCMSNICDIIRKCSTSTTFIQRVTSLKLYHLLIYAFIYTFNALRGNSLSETQKNEVEQINASTLSIYSACLSDAQLAAQSQLNGLALYILAIVTGLVVVPDSQRSLAVKILSTLCSVADKSTMLSVVKLVPKPVAEQLSSANANAINTFQGTYENPDMIWREKMREELIDFLQQEITTHIQRVRNSDGPVDWRLNDSFVMKYSAVEDEIQINGIFVRVFNERMAESKYKLTSDPIAFLQQVVRRFVEEVRADGDKQTIFMLMEAIYHVLLIDPIFAKNDVLYECLATLFNVIRDENSPTDSIVLSLHIIYTISSNRTILERFANEGYVDRLFDYMTTLNDYSEMFLFVILAYTRQHSSVVKRLIDKQRVEFLFNILRSGREQNLKLRSAFVLKAMILDNQYGMDVLNSPQWKEFEEKFNTYYVNIELPPVNVPLPIPAPTGQANAALANRNRSSLGTAASARHSISIKSIPTDLGNSEAPQTPDTSNRALPIPPVKTASSPTSRQSLPSTPTTPQIQPQQVFNPPPQDTTVPVPPPIQQQTSVPPPPPLANMPPPPPLTIAPPQFKQSSASRSNTPVASSPVTGDRGDLLASIRKGAMLKKVDDSEKKISDGLPSSRVSTPETGMSANPMLAALMSMQKEVTKKKDKDSDDEWDDDE